MTGPVWKELGRSPIRVLTPRGFEKARVDPGVELSYMGQLAEGHSELARRSASRGGIRATTRRTVRYSCQVFVH